MAPPLESIVRWKILERQAQTTTCGWVDGVLCTLYITRSELSDLPTEISMIQRPQLLENQDTIMPLIPSTAFINCCHDDDDCTLPTTCLDSTALTIPSICPDACLTDAFVLK